VPVAPQIPVMAPVVLSSGTIELFTVVAHAIFVYCATSRFGKPGQIDGGVDRVSMQVRSLFNASVALTRLPKT